MGFNIMEEYDAIIVGAGTAGALAAKTIAKSGLSTCIVEKLEHKNVGVKVCGEAVGEHHLNDLKLGRPKNGALGNKIHGIKVYSPDRETVFTVASDDFKGYMLDRQLFGQWLLGEALDSGAKLMDSTMFLEPIMEKESVKGIVARGPEGKVELRSKVVVDATGYYGTVRRSLPDFMGIERDFAGEDVEICYREVIQMRKEPKNMDYCDIYLNQSLTPGGYMWIFPKKNGQMNLGIGVYMKKGFQSPKNLYFEHDLIQSYQKGSTSLKMGGGMVPTRRPLDKIVGNGVVIIGDAASLVNPIHGGGIGPSMKSGFYAGEAIVKAIEEESTSEEALWPFASEYMRSYGKKQASLDIFRRFLIGAKDKGMNYGMKNEILTENDVLKAGLGENFGMDHPEKLKRIIRGISHLGFINKLRITVSMMKEIKAHYNTYPESPVGFENWQIKTIELIDTARTKLQD